MLFLTICPCPRPPPRCPCRWVTEAGGVLSEEDLVLEVSPLVSYEGEGLRALVEGQTFEESYDYVLQVRGRGTGRVRGERGETSSTFTR